MSKLYLQIISFSKINSSISDSVIEANLLLEAAILAGCYDCGVISSFHAEPPWHRHPETAREAT